MGDVFDGIIQPKDLIEQLREQMHAAAKDLEFEIAASLRDEILKLEKMVKRRH